MKPTPPPNLLQRRVTADDAYAMYRAWSAFCTGMASRPLRLAGGAAVQVADDVARGLIGPWNPGGLAEDTARTLGLLGMDLLGVPSSAAADAVSRFDGAPSLTQAKIEAALAGSDPAATVTRVQVDPSLAEAQWRDLAAKAGADPDLTPPAFPTPDPSAPFLLPARVLDASQAWAAWFVPFATAQALLRDAVESGHQPPEVLDAFVPVTVGPGDAMVTLVASDYRASDFGVLQEIGLTLSVTPRGSRFPDPGQLFLRLIVTDAHSVAVARQVWGIRKDLHDNATAAPGSRIDVAYGSDRVRFGQEVTRPGAAGPVARLGLEFPRLGQGRSDHVPGLIHSMVGPQGLPAAPETPARSVLTRSGEGEGVQFRGPVTVDLPTDRASGQAAGCLCAGGMACLCDTLRGLGLDQRRPAANGWTEHMSCELAEPTRIADQSSGKTSP